MNTLPKQCVPITFEQKKMISILFKCTNRHCQNTEDNIVVEERTEIISSHLKYVKCSKCKHFWIICETHHLKWNNRLLKQAYLHFSQCEHIQPNFKRKIDSIDTVDELFFSENNDINALNTVGNDSHSYIYPQENINMCFMNKYCQKYFTIEASQKWLGINSIICSSFKQRKNDDSHECNNFEILYHLLVSKFVYTLTETKQNEFASIISLVSNNYSSNFVNTFPPTTFLEINQYYTKNSTAIIPNLPIPSIYIKHDHIYVSIKEIISLVLASGHEIDGCFLNSPPGLVSSLYYESSLLSKTLISQQRIIHFRDKLQSSNVSPLIIFTSIWSDDFEPNSVKKTKSSIWMKTLTICPRDYQQTSKHHTYIISLGPKGSNHNEVNQLFEEEFKSLQDIHYFYSSITQSNIPVIVDNIITNLDRPERSSINGILSHNGTTTCRWRYSSYISKQTKLPSCQNCFIKIFNTVYKLQNKIEITSIFGLCNECANWDYFHKLVNTNTPQDYPNSVINKDYSPPLGRGNSNSGQLGSVEITYKYLKQGVRFAFYNLYNRKWTIANTRCYFQSLGIQNKMSQRIIDYTRLCRDNDNINFEDSITQIQLPSTWNGIHDLDQSIDAPMHLICLGIIKSVFKLSSDWLSGMVSSKHKLLGNSMNDLFIEISTLHLDWCKVTSLSTNDEKFNTTNWVSENYLALGRLLLVIYGPVRELIHSSEEVCINEFECSIMSLFILLSNLLCDDADDHCLIDRIIRVFLSSFNQFESMAFNLSPKEKPTWLSKGNFLSLLNLPETIQKFGPIRLYWDGNRERTIQYIKPFLIHTRKTPTYYKTKLCSVMRVQIIDNIINQLRIDTNISKQDRGLINELKQYDRVTSFKCYRTLTEITSNIKDKKVISCVILKDVTGIVKTFICYKPFKEEYISLIEVLFLQRNVENSFGLWYFPTVCNVTHYESSDYTKTNIETNAIDFGLLLPLNDFILPDNDMYTVITKNWKVLTQNHLYKLISIPKPLFSLIEII